MIDTIEGIVARHFGVSLEELHGVCREQDITDAKHFLRYFLCKVGYSKGDIAKRYNTTERVIRRSCGLIRDGVQMQPFYAKHCAEIQKELKELNILEA